MLNNSAIIEKLSEEQKLALVTDIACAEQESLNALGVPHVEKSDLDALNISFCGGAYPNLNSLAHSWNTELVENAVGDIVRRDGTAKVNIISTPDIGVKCNPYSVGFSEDPYLCAKMGNSIVSAAESAGGAAVVDGLALTNADIEYLDRTPDNAVISNILSRPFDAVMKCRVASAVGIEFNKLKGEWKDVNKTLANAALRSDCTRAIIASHADEEELREGLSEKRLVFLGADSSVVRAALKNYKRMKKDVERGSVTLAELEAAVKAGTAVSEEMLDAAADKVLDFLRSVVRNREQYQNSVTIESSDVEGVLESVKVKSDTALLCPQESTVLLKNAGGVLPIVQAVKVAAVGELISAFPDFDAAADRICALRGAEFIGRADGYALDSERSDLLAAKAVELGVKADVILAVVGLGARREKNLPTSKNVKLPANQIAMLDMLGKTGKTVIAVVTGNILPDMKFDSLAQAVLYAPLGGLRGAESLFSILFGMICPSGKLAFTAYDDVDEYFSRQKNDIALGRYKAGEFIGYRRYTSENAKLRYPFGFGLSYTKFDYSDLIINAESVDVSVRNTGGRAGFEVVQLYVGKNDSAVIRPARELKGFAKVMIEPGATAKITFPLTAAMLEVYDAKSGTRKTEDGKYQIYVGASSADIRLSGEMIISGGVLGFRDEKLSDYLPTLTNIASGGYKFNSAEDTQGAFKSARHTDGSYDYEKLFIDEFGSDNQESNEQVQSGEFDISLFLGDSVTVKTIAEGLSAFALTKGFKLDSVSTQEIVAALAASRAVILRTDENTFDTLTEILSGYFGCPKYLDKADDYKVSDDLFYSGAETSFNDAVKYASSHGETVTIAALDNVVADRLGEVFAPFIRYAAAPDNMTVTFGESSTLNVTPNMWFVMRLADGNKAFPLYLADIATVIMPELKSAKVKPADVALPNYYQFVAACQNAEREYEIDEPYWKKADRLEDYVGKRAPFKMSNKMCVQMEKYIAVLLFCGGEQSDALDRAVAAKLIPHIVYALDGKLTAEDDNFVQTLDNIFGDGEAPRCKIAAKRAKA